MPRVTYEQREEKPQNIKNSAVAEKSLAAHRLLKIKSTEDKSYQISAENCLRKRD